MKTITVRELRHRWPEVSRWLKSGIEIQVTERGELITRMVPIARNSKRRKRPDFMARLKRIYGDKLCPETGTQLVDYDRGEV